MNEVKVKRSLVFDYVNSHAWAIHPEKLEIIHNVLFNKSLGSDIRFNDILAAYGDSTSAGAEYYSKKGIAVIPVHGPIAKRMNIMSALCGGCSTEVLGEQLEHALADDSIAQIVFDVDSPGGTVDGTKEVVDLIYASRGKKPITAYITGEGCSGAYWIASAADKIVAYETSLVGSVGVVSAHTDYSKAYEMEGVKKTYITAGKYKRIANEAEPLSAEAKDYLQSFVDGYYTMFVESVARNRGVSVEKVLSDMANGKVFLADDAMKVGLIDEIGHIKTIFKGGKANTKRIAASATDIKEDEVMDLNTIKTQHTEVYEALRAEISSEFTSKVDAVQADVKVKDSEIAKLKVENDKLDTINKDLVKQLSVTNEQMSISLAENIKAAILVESDIPESLHAKVRAMVDFHAYTKDGDSFVEGSESVTAFTEAFKNEVSSWETALPKKGKVGLGEGKKIVGGSNVDTDMELGQELARQFAGSIRSDGE